MNRSVLGRKILSSVITFSIAMQGQLAFADYDAREVVHDVSSQLKKIAGTKASFCFAVDNGSVKGYNENDPVRTASVTKTITAFWAVERLGPNFQYTTKIYVQPSNHEIHIEGQRDPFFDRDRMFTLLADLNRKGMKEINRLTYDKNFWFWPDATELRYMQGSSAGVWSHAKGKASHGKARAGAAHPGRGHARGHRRHAVNLPTPPARTEESVTRLPASITRAPASFTLGNKQFKHFVEAESHTDKTLAGDPDRIASYLKVSLNTSAWGAEMKNRFAKARAMNPVLQLPQAVQMKTNAIDLVPTNPLAGKPGVFVFTVKSAPIRQYLKLMNIWSINPWAEEIFFSLGGKDQFQTFMQSRYSFGPQVSNVNTGSGVNMHGNARNDSTVSCSSVVRMIRRMDLDLETKWKMDLSDILSVPGHDGGTWVDPSKTLVVKTGTLKNPTPAKNLAGVAETTDGEVYFGIFVDRQGGNKYTVQKALTALRSNFEGVQVKESPFTFNPVGNYTHLQLVGQHGQILAKK